MKRKTSVKFVSVKASSPQIRRTRVPNLGRWIIFTESTRDSYKIKIKNKYKGYKIKTKQCLFLTRLTNKIFLHTSTKCVRPSEIFCTSYLVFSIVVFRETTSTEHKSASCSSSPSIESSAKGTVRSVSESDGVSDGAGSRKTLFFRLFEGPRRALDAGPLVLDLVACFIFFFWVASTFFFFFIKWTCYYLCYSNTRIWL